MVADKKPVFDFLLRDGEEDRIEIRLYSRESVDVLKKVLEMALARLSHLAMTGEEGVRIERPNEVKRAKIGRPSKLTPEVEKCLRALYADPHMSSKIAAASVQRELGVSLSRNTIAHWATEKGLGKVGRGGAREAKKTPAMLAYIHKLLCNGESDTQRIAEDVGSLFVARVSADNVRAWIRQHNLDTAEPDLPEASAQPASAEGEAPLWFEERERIWQLACERGVISNHEVREAFECDHIEAKEILELLIAEGRMRRGRQSRYYFPIEGASAAPAGKKHPMPASEVSHLIDESDTTSAEEKHTISLPHEPAGPRKDGRGVLERARAAFAQGKAYHAYRLAQRLKCSEDEASEAIKALDKEGSLVLRHGYYRCAEGEPAHATGEGEDRAPRRSPVETVDPEEYMRKHRESLERASRQEEEEEYPGLRYLDNRDPRKKEDSVRNHTD